MSNGASKPTTPFPASSPFTSSTALLIYCALLKLLLHLLTNSQYGFHRDELYYIVGGYHPDFGYVDHPPLTPLLARLSVSLFDETVAGLRFLPAVAGAVIVFLTGLIAREMGAGRYAQLLAALTILAAPLYLLTNTLFQTVVFDQLIWVLCCYLLLRILNGADKRLWLLIGLVIGIGLEIKYTVVFFGAALAVGLLLTPARAELRQRWLWLGGLIALLIFLPNLVWQATNGWPTLEFLSNNNANYRNGSSLLEFFLIQIPMTGLLTFPLFIAGIYNLFSPAAKPYRSLGWSYIILMLILVLLRGKPYYPGPLYPLIFASGAVFIERVISQREGQSQRWSTLRPTLILITIISGLIAAPLMLPILPKALFAQYQEIYPHNDFAEMFGWEELVESVAQAYEQLPTQLQDETLILTSNYGSASAVNLFGSQFDLPAAVSGHNSYYFWRPNKEPRALITIGIERDSLETACGQVAQVGTISNGYAIDNEEADRPLYLCTEPKTTLQASWMQLKHFE